MDPIAEEFPTPISTLIETPSSTLAQIIEQLIVEHFSNTESSIMAAPSIVPAQEAEVIYQTKYINPFSDCTDAIYEYIEPVLTGIKDAKAYAAKSFEKNIPAWIQGWIVGLFNFAWKSGAILFALCFLGFIAFETSFTIFRALGLMPRHHFLLIKQTEWQREEKMEKMEKKKFEALCEQNAKLHQAITDGGHWLWGSSTTVMLGYIFFSPESSFFKALGWALVYCLGIFTVLPYVCAWITRFVVPEAMLCVSWLGREEDPVPAVLVVEEVQKVRFKDPIAPQKKASRIEPPFYKLALHNDEKVAEYLNEAKRVGYGKRAAMASSRGGLPASVRD
jgi:hypothetical protein